MLKALHNLFIESPAKREDLVKLTGTETFPLPFCGHRWLENKQVAERALEIVWIVGDLDEQVCETGRVGGKLELHSSL